MQVRSAQRQPPVVGEGAISGWELSTYLGQLSSAQTAVSFAFEPPRGHGVAIPVFGPGPSVPNSRSSKEKAPSINTRKARACPRCHSVNCEGKFNSKPCAPRACKSSSKPSTKSGGRVQAQTTPSTANAAALAAPAGTSTLRTIWGIGHAAGSTSS